MNIKTIRNWLNFIFIIAAIAGMYLYYASSKEMGIYVILGAILIKFTESALRMLKV